MMGREVKSVQKIGVLVIIVGVALMISDPDSKRVGQKEANMFGSIMSLFVNIPYVFFFLINVRLNKAISEKKG